MKKQKQFFIHQVQRRLPKAEARAIAKIHCRSLEHGFLTELGQKFLTQLYTALAAAPGVVTALAYTTDSLQIAGFAVAAADTKQAYRKVFKQHALRLAWALLPALLRPALWRKIVEAAGYSRREDRELPAAQLLNLCVDPEYQRQGVGQELFEDIAAALILSGAEQIAIVTGSGQIAAQKFYRKLGARRLGETQIHRGSISEVLVFDLAGHTGSTDHKRALQ